MAFLKLEVDGAVQLSRNLLILSDNIDKLKPFYKDTVDIVENRSNSLFYKEGKNVQKAKKWEPLSQSTKTAREKKWGYYKKKPNNPGVLRRTGNLQDNTTKRVQEKFGQFKFNAPYAIYHHRGNKNLPKRVLIDLDNVTNAKIVRSLQGLINKQIYKYDNLT